MTSKEILSEALSGFVALVKEHEPKVAVCPVLPNLEKSGQRLSEALQSIPVKAERRVLVSEDKGKENTIGYVVFQYNIADVQTRVHRYTAQKARMLSQSAEGDMVGLLTLSPDQDLLFMEYLSTAAQNVYNAISAYSRELPFRACVFNEGVDISVMNTKDVEASAWLKGDYVRVKDTPDEQGVIYAALQDVPADTSLENAAYWEKQPEIADTNGRVTFLVCEDKSCPTWDIQTLSRIYDSIYSYLFYAVLAEWYSLAERQNEAAANTIKAADAIGSAALGLDNKLSRHSNRPTFNGGYFAP